MKNNATIIHERVEAFNRRAGPRVGDYLKLPRTDPRQGEFTRFTHDWGDHIQTGGGEHGQYYLMPHGYLSYSGSLDPGLAKAAVLPLAETKPGAVWFFDGDISGAGRGVDCMVPMRVFVPHANADLSSIGELRCPYHLCVLGPDQHQRTCGYWYTITRHAISQTAFRTEDELRAWLTQNALGLSHPLTPPGEPSSQSLVFVGAALATPVEASQS
jgi:hypothetical protein